MIHPATQLRHVSAAVGLGIFATQPIPKGTLVYVKDALEIQIPADHPLLQHPEYQELINTYSYTEPNGFRIISWDLAKYVNHCCQCNTISTGYGFEIAIRNIEAGEEITDEYGLFNPETSMELRCDQPGCRKIIHPEDIDTYHLEWDQKIKAALAQYRLVDQPLTRFVDPEIKQQLDDYLDTGLNFKSVLTLKQLPIHKSLTITNETTN